MRKSKICIIFKIMNPTIKLLEEKNKRKLSFWNEYKLAAHKQTAKEEKLLAKKEKDKYEK